MKKINILIILFFFTLSASAQVLIAERASDLMPELYTIQGKAFLQEYDSGVLTLSLSENFNTPPGPDVRILLSNSLSLTGAVEIVNLSDINHFNGAYSIDLSSDIEIEDYQYILFFCVQFQQFWASGEFGETTNPGGAFVCLENATIAGNGSSEVDVCSTDGASDVVGFSNSISATAGSNYAYLITDENEILQEVVLNSSYDFEGSTIDVQRVYGIHYDGTLNTMIGENRLETTATECFIHSDGAFITITKDACSAPFECLESLTATTDWRTSVDLCVTDGEPDPVFIKNNIQTDPGDNYVFLLTDTNEILQEIIIDSIYDFEGTDIEELRVYGISYSGSLVPAIGEVRQNTTASNCFIHSGDIVFLTINKIKACATPVLDVAISAQVLIYPSPVSDMLNIEIPNEFEAKQISVYNMLGIEVMQHNIELSNFIQLNVSPLDVGNYVLRIKNDEEWLTRKVSIIR